MREQGDMGEVAGHLYELARSVRVCAAGIGSADPDSRIPGPLFAWADRLDAAAGLSACRLSLVGGVELGDRALELGAG